MPRSPDRRWVALWLLLFVVLASFVLATPWGEPARRTMRPWLPRVVVIVATISGIGQLVTSLVAGVVRRGGWRAAQLPLLLGISALFMALAFFPTPPATVPRTPAIVGAALCALAAAVLQRRARKRAEL